MNLILLILARKDKGRRIFGQCNPNSAPNSLDDNDTWNRVFPGNDNFDSFPRFMSSHGLNPNIEVPSDVEHSVSFFLSLFFTDSLLKHLVDCTNSRAELELEKTLGDNVKHQTGCEITDIIVPVENVHIRGNEEGNWDPFRYGSKP